MTFRRRRVVAGLSPVGAAALGGLGSRHAPEIYRTLKKPPWAPPETAFGPVWSALYLLIGAAGWRMAGRPTSRTVWSLHGSQLLLNAAWPWAFFSTGRKATSLIIIGSLDAALMTEKLLLARRDRTSALLLAPYLSWCIFATALNCAVGAPEEV